jgi:hypothetical protein
VTAALAPAVLAPHLHREAPAPLSRHDVTAIIVTRGDVDLEPVLASLAFSDVVVWDNSCQEADEGAYGRYRAVQRTRSKVVYFQDDDCVVPADDQIRLVDAYEPGVLAALMPPERVDYTDTVLVGWGSLCDWHLPGLAFGWWRQEGHDADSREFKVVGCDFVFPMLTPWRRLDGYHRDLPHAHAPNRTWASFPDYAAVKARYMADARAMRDRQRQGGTHV